MTQYRLHKYDKHNYSIQEFVPEHQYKGKDGVEKVSAAKWKDIGYYGKLDAVLSKLINLHLHVEDKALLEQLIALREELRLTEARLVEMLSTP